KKCVSYFHVSARTDGRPWLQVTFRPPCYSCRTSRCGWLSVFQRANWALVARKCGRRSSDAMWPSTKERLARPWCARKVGWFFGFTVWGGAVQTASAFKADGPIKLPHDSCERAPSQETLLERTKQSPSAIISTGRETADSRVKRKRATVNVF